MLICPSCSAENSDNSRFCLNCGTPLAGAAPAQPPAPAPETAPAAAALPQPAAAPPPAAAVPPPPVYPAVPPALPPAPEPLGYPPPPPLVRPAGAPAPVYPPPYPASPTAQAVPLPPPPAPAAYPASPGAPVAPYPAIQPQTATPPFLNIWGPFAGQGKPRRHAAWLVKDRGEQSAVILPGVLADLQSRQVPGMVVYQTMLPGRAIAATARPYLLLRRGPALVGLYAEPCGRDLYLSLASYVRTPLDPWRIGLLVLMVLAWLFMVFVFPGWLGDAGQIALATIGNSAFGAQAASPSDFFYVLCVVGIPGALNNFALLAFLVFSLYRWLTQRDALAALRIPANEFFEDDRLLMEKLAADALRQAGIDLA